MPFCANVIAALGTPKDFIVAQLVAPVWSTLTETSIVWPSKAFPSKDAQFTTEEFVDSVIEDVRQRFPIQREWIFSLGWSSSGHVLYSSSFQNPKIRGTFIAMSRFQPAWFPESGSLKGKRYYFWHSPDDAICPYVESQSAAAYLTQAGALTWHRSYPGGHRWMPNTFYADRIKEALEWFRMSEPAAAEVAAKAQAAKPGH